MALAWTVFPGAKSRFRKIEFHERRQCNLLSGAAAKTFLFTKIRICAFLAAVLHSPGGADRDRHGR
jgi:hypothetical protein